LVALAGVVTAGFRGIMWGQPGTLIVDPFWVNFFLATYQDGFRRRALVGTLVRFVFPGSVDVWVINIFAAIVLVICLALFFYALTKTLEEKRQARLWIFLLFASPFTAVFFEVLGDLLQVALVVFCLSMFAATRWIKSGALRVLVGLAAATIGFLAHEAALLFLLPALPFFLKQRPRLRDFVVPVLAMAALLGLSSHWGHVHPTPTYAAITHPGGGRYYAPNDATPDFRGELAWEENHNFGSTEAKMFFAERCVSITLLALAIGIALVHTVRFAVFARVVQALLVILFFSSPLWYFAHDWGRFLAYAIFLSVTSTLAVGVDRDEGVPRPFYRISSALQRLCEVEILGYGFAFVLLTGACGYNHFDGVNFATLRDFGLIAIVALMAQIAMRRDRLPLKKISEE
jgi:hypothetical protein